MTAPIRDAAGNRVFHYSQTRAKPARQRKTPEHDFHCQIAQYLTYALPPEVEWTYTLNGVYLGPKQIKDSNDAGLRRGLGDYVLAIPAYGGYEVCMLEAKGPKGRLSEEQKRWAAKLGWKWATVDDLEGVEKAIIRWGITPRCKISEAHRYAVAAGGPGR